MTEKQTYSILLVDDDDFLIDMYSLKFSQAGHQVQSSLNSDNALQKLRAPDYTPDAVLLDLVMPHMDGFELLERIRDEKLVPNAALIVLSNQGEKADLERAKSLGVAGHIIKANAVPSQVLDMVENIIEKNSQ